VRVVVRLPNWLGDTIMTVPLLRALRASIGAGAPLAVAGPWAPVLAGQGLCGPCITYPRSWTGRVRMADTVARLQPDIALVLPHSFEAALSAWYWGARRRIGYDGDGRGWLLTDRVPRRVEPVHQIDEYLELLAPFGAPALERIPRLMPPEDATLDVEAGALLATIPRSGAPVVGVHLGAAFGPSRVLPPDRVAALCRELRRRGATPVLLGSPVDAAFETRVRSHDPGQTASLVGRDSIALLPVLLARLDAVVSGDTGVAHLAAALGTPTVVVFGPTDPDRSGPRGAVSYIRHAVPCAPCLYRVCPIDHPCVRGIPVSEIADRALGCASGARR
jgi:heptosyltransferase-2